MIQFDCPKCLQQINARPAQAGQRIDCPGCNVSLLVPSRQAGDFDDLFDDGEELGNQPDPSVVPKTVTATTTDRRPDQPEQHDPSNQPDQRGLAGQEIPESLLDEIQNIDAKAEPAIRSSPAELNSDVETGAEIRSGSGVESGPEVKSGSGKATESQHDSDDGFDFDFPVVGGGEVTAPQATVEEDPFAVDADKRLEIDGITDFSNAPGTFSMKCEICESHLFVSVHGAGSQVKCPDCFSNLTVPEPTPEQLASVAKQSNESPRANQSKSRFQVADLESSGHATEVDPSFGLAPVEKDLLAPKVDAVDDEFTLQPPTEISRAQDIKPAGQNRPKKTPTTKKKSTKKEPAKKKSTQKKSTNKKAAQKSKSEKTTRSTQNDLNPYRSRSAQEAASKKRLREQQQQQQQKQQRQGGGSSKKNPSDAGQGFPVFEFDDLFAAMMKLVTAWDVVARCGVTAALLAVGNVIGHIAINRFLAIEDPTMGDSAWMVVWRIGMGWTTFAAGTIVLWYFAGTVFRKTAAGRSMVDNWRIGPSVEWTSTFLLIGFSFAVAGLPLLLTGQTWAIAPFRFLLALPMLLSVWFTQSPFHIIAVDAFGHFQGRTQQWKAVGLVVIALAAVAFVAGLLMAVNVGYLNVLTSIVGAMLLSLATLGYAAVAGWHSGKVINELS